MRKTGKRPPRAIRRAAKAAAIAALGMEEAPAPKGMNPSARRVRRLARKGWLIGWPFSKGNL